MSKKTPVLLDRFKGKKIFLEGKFGYHDSDRGWMVEVINVHQGTVKEKLDDMVDILVVTSISKTIQAKVASLNKKGAAIQLLDAAGFQTLAKPSSAELLAILRGGPECGDVFYALTCRLNTLFASTYRMNTAVDFIDENFDGIDISGFRFDDVNFKSCSFVGATAVKTHFNEAHSCNFTNAKMKDADLEGSSLNFTGADLESVSFRYWTIARGKKGVPGCVFTRANLRSAHFEGGEFDAPQFDGADLTGVDADGCKFTVASFKSANLKDASFVEAKLIDADFTNADLRNADFAEANLSNACFDGADLEDCSFHNATLTGAKLGKAKNYNTGTKPVGPALTSLNAAAQTSGRIEIGFQVCKKAGEPGESVGIDTEALTKYGWGVQLADTISDARTRVTSRLFSDALAKIVKAIGTRKILFETLTIETRKSSVKPKELRELVIAGITEASGQTPPAADVMAEAAAAHRKTVQEQKAAERVQQKAAAKKAEKEKVKELQRIEKKIEKAVGGKVSDVATFLKALELRIERPKIDKATKMLKADGFKLFNDVTETHLNGVVKSQTDPDLVYACRLEANGKYSCCTQNLNVCGGLRGSICKHLLVLIIGLVQANELDPTTIDGWVAKSNKVKPELNKETMGEVFIRYKGAEAGEVDWRPTQTVPEDYYSL